MSARPFAPIWITLPDCTPRRVDSVFEALECLTAAWPARNSLAYRRAVRICRDALDGFLPVEIARRAFLAAADALDGAIVQETQRDAVPAPHGRRAFGDEVWQ